MKKLIILFSILFSSNAFAGVFSSNKDSTLVKIKTGDKEFTFIDIGKNPIVYDAEKNEAHIGYHDKSGRDHTGHHSLIFLPLKTFSFDTESQFEKWIKSVKSSYKCLTVEGIVKC
jgi:hypothetical protein